MTEPFDDSARRQHDLHGHPFLKGAVASFANIHPPHFTATDLPQQRVTAQPPARHSNLQYCHGCSSQSGMRSCAFNTPITAARIAPSLWRQNECKALRCRER